MAFQDPIFNVTQQALPSGNAFSVLNFIRTVALSAGWTVDKWDTTPGLGTETGGVELYIHPTVYGQPPYYSLKGFNGSLSDHEAIKVWLNGGHSSQARADNQPQMLAAVRPHPTNAADRSQVFAGDWDQSGANRNPGNPSQYLTAPYDAMNPLAGPVPTIPADECGLHTFSSSSIDQIYGFYDQNGTDPSQCIIIIWYLGNTMYGLVMGHVLWDTTPQEQGWLLNAWVNKRDEFDMTNTPCNNSLGGTVYPAEQARAPIEVIRNRTNGSETFPAGTPNGVPLIYSGPVVMQQDRVEASDNISNPNISAIVRPDMSFDAFHNNVQGDAFPNPRITVHREVSTLPLSQERLGFHRPRHISRFPDGGALTGDFAAGAGTEDWSDSGFSFPQYYAPLVLQRDGDIVTEGLRQYMLFPGNRSGAMPYTQAWRVAGLAMRIA